MVIHFLCMGKANGWAILRHVTLPISPSIFVYSMILVIFPNLLRHIRYAVASSGCIAHPSAGGRTCRYGDQGWRIFQLDEHPAMKF